MTFKMHLLTELINDLLTKENREEKTFINVHSSFISEFRPFFFAFKKNAKILRVFLFFIFYSVLVNFGH